ncbi:MAG TPA: hypothetical protein VIS29_14780 [Streptomyces sp.]
MSDALTPAQLDGRACITCGIDYTTAPELIRNRPVGFVHGVQVFGCVAHDEQADTTPKEAGR